MLIQIDFESAIPIYTQLRDQVVIGISNGSLKPGEPLPSVRRLSADIGIHAHTVNKSYAQLRDEGYIIIDRRSGCRVADKNPIMDEAFRNELRYKLLPIIAEASCHGMSGEDFKQLCMELLGDLEKQKEGGTKP